MCILTNEKIRYLIERVRLICVAMKYDENEFDLFVSKLGLVDLKKDFNAAEAELIDSILLDIFNEAQIVKKSNQ